MYCMNCPLIIPFKLPYLFILLILIGIPFILGEGFIANMVGLQNEELSKEHKVASIVIAFGSFFVTYIMIVAYSNINNMNIYSMIGLSIGIIFAYIIIPLLIALSFRDSGTEGKNLTNSGVGGVLQDGLLWTILSIVMNSAIYSLLLHNSIHNCVVILASTVPSMVWPISFCAANNAKHIKQENKSSLNKEQINALQTHLRCQNLVLFIALLPIGICILLKAFLLLLGLTNKECDGRSIIEKFKSLYWPTA